MHRYLEAEFKIFSLWLHTKRGRENWLIMLEGETLSNSSVQMKSLERTVPDTETSDTKIFR